MTSKMNNHSEYQKIPVSMEEFNEPSFWISMVQRCQITYKTDDIIEINWHEDTSRAFIRTNTQCFFLTKSDTTSITISDVIQSLDYSYNEYNVSWIDDSSNSDAKDSIPNTPIEFVAVHQATIN